MAISRIRTGKKQGKYRVRIQPISEETGKVVSIPSQVASTRLEATKLERKMWNDYYQGKYSPKSEIEFSKALTQYCDQENNAGRWNKVTYATWNYTCRLVTSYFGKTKLREVNENMVRAFARNYIATHKNAGVSRHSTIDKQLQHLRSYFGLLQEEGAVVVNPVPKNALRKFFRIDEFSVSAEKYVFSDEEVEKIKESIFNSLFKLPTDFWGSRIAVLIVLDVGMRPQEIQAVKWSQLVDEGNYKVFIINDAWSEKLNGLNGHLKGRARGVSRKTLNISPEVLSILKIYHVKQNALLHRRGIINKNDFILLNCRDKRLMKSGIPIGQKSMNDLLKKICQKVGVANGDKQISMYTCRHTVATKLGNTAGMSYPWAASRMGHSLEMFMKTYVHADKNKNQEMMDLMNNTSENAPKLKSI